MRTAMVSIEGVLAEERSSNLLECPPTIPGILLWNALRKQYEMTLVSMMFPSERIRLWCEKENVLGAVRVFTPLCEGLQSEYTDCVEIFRRARHLNVDLQLFVSASPNAVRAAYDSGIHSMLSVSPAYGRAEWRPDFVGTPKPWDELIEEAEASRALMRSDERRTMAE